MGDRWWPHHQAVNYKEGRMGARRFPPRKGSGGPCSKSLCCPASNKTQGPMWTSGTSPRNANVRVVSTGAVPKALLDISVLCDPTPSLLPSFWEGVPWRAKQRHSVYVLFRLPSTLCRHLLESTEGARHNILTTLGAWSIDSTRGKRRSATLKPRDTHTFPPKWKVEL